MKVIILMLLLVLFSLVGNSFSCTTNGDCTNSGYHYCYDLTCFECLTNEHCSSGECLDYYCSQSYSECISNADCTSEGYPYCSGNWCVECIDGTNCSSGECLYGYCSQSYTECVSNGDCFSIWYPYCLGSSCVECISNAGCTSEGYPYCSGNSCVECIDGTNCSSGECLSGSCYEYYPECISDGDCSGYYSYCVGNMCVECLSSQDCASEWYPYCSENFCAECLSSEDCAGTSTPYCLESMCVECFSSGDCTDDLYPYCSGSWCVECISNTDCLSDQMCDIDGYCFQPSCYNDDDCSLKGSLYCLNYNCFDCYSNGDCSSQDCFLGYCYESYSECVSNADCTSEGYPYCSGNSCVECIDGTNCSSGECLSGSCYEYPECISDGDCSGYYSYCVGNMCVECLSNQDCASELDPYCSENFCAECLSSEDCAGTSTPYCLESMCVECFSSGDCTDDLYPYCSGSWCVECISNTDCLSDQMCDYNGNCFQPSCYKNDDCSLKGSLYCLNYNCFDCYSNGDCSSQDCFGGYCYGDATETSTNDSTTETSTNDSTTETSTNDSTTETSTNDSATETSTNNPNTETSTNNPKTETSTNNPTTEITTNNSTNPQCSSDDDCSNGKCENNLCVQTMIPVNTTGSATNDDDELTDSLPDFGLNLGSNLLDGLKGLGENVSLFQQEYAENLKSLGDTINNYIKSYNDTKPLLDCSTCDQCSNHGTGKSHPGSTVVDYCECESGYIGVKCDMPYEAVKDLIEEITSTIDTLKEQDITTPAQASYVLYKVQLAIEADLYEDPVEMTNNLIDLLTSASQQINPENIDLYANTCSRCAGNSCKYKSSKSSSRMLADLNQDEVDTMEKYAALLKSAFDGFNYSSLTSNQLKLNNETGGLNAYVGKLVLEETITAENPYVFKELEMQDDSTTTRVKISSETSSSQLYYALGLLSSSMFSNTYSPILLTSVYDSKSVQDPTKFSASIVLDTSLNYNNSYLVCGLFDGSQFASSGCSGSTNGTSLSCNCSKLGYVTAIESSPINEAAGETPSTEEKTAEDFASLNFVVGFIMVLVLSAINL